MGCVFAWFACLEKRKGEEKPACSSNKLQTKKKKKKEKNEIKSRPKNLKTKKKKKHVKFAMRGALF